MYIQFGSISPVQYIRWGQVYLLLMPMCIVAQLELNRCELTSYENKSSSDMIVALLLLRL